MTITDPALPALPELGAVPPPGRPLPIGRILRTRRLSEPGLWLPVAIMAVTVVVRLVDVTTFSDINSDEVNYTDLARSIQHGAFPPKFDGAPFVLHPPAFFSFGGLWFDLWNVHGSYLNFVNSLRYMNVAFAAASAVFIYALGVRMVGRSVGAGAALLFALDPYILRENGRAMLETSTLTLVLAGYVVLLSVLQSRARRPRASAVVGGLLLGLGIVDKDMAVILVVVPLAVLLWRDMGISRRLVLIALGAALAPYALYVVALAIRGYLPFYISQQTLGLRRQLGLVQATGFNAPGSPSLFSVAMAQLAHYGVTYLLSGLGFISSIYLLVRGSTPALRVWSVVTLASGVTLAYSVVFGTIEEQMLYFMYVPSLVALMAGAVVFARSRFEARPIANHRFRRAVAWTVILFSFYNLGVWAQIRATPNDGLARVVSWFHTHAPQPGVIGNDTQVTAMLLKRDGFQAVQIADPETAAADHVRYLTILSASLVGRYGNLDPAQAGFFEHYGKLVYRYRENTYGTVSIYETTAPSIW